MIPKKNKPGKWRLIVDLSSPTGASVNDGIDKSMCRLSYTSVGAVAKQALCLGRGWLLAKMDIKHAYRIVPVHPVDRLLLGMKWDGRVLADKTLPFGLPSAPLIFTAVADVLMWLMQTNGVSIVDHYLDDFITIGRPGMDECSKNFQCMLETCSTAGVPVEAKKSEGPTTSLVFLGIEIDTVAMQLRLPQDKLDRLRETVAVWRGRTDCRKRELMSLIESVSHACKVIKQGRAFFRRLIDLSECFSWLDHFIRINVDARSDIERWFRFASTWNGVSLLY